MAKVRALMSGAGQAPILESLYATENGNYTPSQGVDGFDDVTVAVPEPVIITKNIVANGTYNAVDDNATGYSTVNVNVPAPAPNLYDPGTITQNGTYTVPTGYDGFTSFEVNVQPPAYDCVRVWTQSTGGSNASVNIQEGTYSNGIFTPIGTVQNLIYTQASSPVAYFNTLSIQYQSGWKMRALSDGLNLNGTIYNTDDMMAQWSYDQNQNYFVLKP